MHAGVTISEYNTLRPNRRPLGLQQSLFQKLEEEFFDIKDDSYKSQTVLERSSFTSICCIPQSDRSNTRFYWVDSNRGLLGEGRIEQCFFDEAQGVKVIAPKNETICDLRVLLKDLKSPAWLAVAPKESLSHKVFYTEQGQDPKGGRGGISMLDTKTGMAVPILTNLHEIRGLQIMDTMDMFFLERGASGDCFRMMFVDGRVVDKAREGEQVEKKELFAVWEKMKQGHCVRYEDFTVLPDGRILLAARITNTADSEAQAQGAVYMLRPSSITEEGVLPPFSEEPEKHEHEGMKSDENGAENVKMEGGMGQLLPVEADPVSIEGSAQIIADNKKGLVLPSMAAEENGLGQEPSMTVFSNSEVTQVPPSAPTADEFEAKLDNSTSLNVIPKATTVKTEKKQDSDRKISQTSNKPLKNVPVPQKSLEKKVGKETKTPKIENPGRRPSKKMAEPPPAIEEVALPVFVPRPRPIIPKLNISRVEEVMFYSGVPQPVPVDPLTACRRKYHRALYTYDEGEKSVLLECLPSIRTITTNPFTGRVVVGFCGADPKGFVCSFGLVDLSAEAPCTFRPIMGGFNECLAIDAFDTVITRSGRKDGRLGILWAKGSHGWGELLLREARLVHLPSSPKENERDMERTENMGLKMMKEMQTLRQDTQVQDASSKSGKVNTMVVLRCRPLLEHEKEAQSAISCTKYDVTVDGSYLPLKQNKVFSFDRVFDGTAKQQEIYSSVVAPMVERVLEGFHSTIFAYGQTGSGKTFTMEGSMDDTELAGIIPRSVFTLFKMLGRLQDSSYSVHASHIEIYNQHIFDLLDESNTSQNLKVEEDELHRSHLRGARQVLITSPNEIFRVLRKSMKNRHTAETLCNRVSSRSHAIFSITVKCTYVTGKDGKVNVDGRLNLVDLSGSENIKRSGSEGLRAKEAGNIGQSLLAFSRVITGLVQSTPHIPYRDSKLTHLLSDSLGGNSYTTIILNVTPSHYVLDETLNTLNYAALARHVHTTPIKHMYRKVIEDGEQEKAIKGGEQEAEELGGLPVMPWRGSIPLVRSHQATTVKREMKLYHSISKEWVEANLLDNNDEIRQSAVHLLRSVYDNFDTQGKGRLCVLEVKRMEESWFESKEGECQEACKPPMSRKPARAGNPPLLPVGHKKVLTFGGFLGFIKSIALKDPVLVKRILRSVGSGQAVEGDNKEKGTLPNNELTIKSAAIVQEATKTRQAMEATLPVSSGFIQKGEILKWLEKEVKPKVIHSRPKSAQTSQRKMPTPATNQSIPRMNVSELYESSSAKHFRTPKLRPNSAPLTQIRGMPSPRNFRMPAHGLNVPNTEGTALVTLLQEKPGLPSCEWCSKEIYPGSKHAIAFCSPF